MNGKQKFLEAYDTKKLSCGNRCYWKCGCHDKVTEWQHKLIGGEVPEFHRSPNPTLILWENLGVGAVSRCCRAALVYFLSALIIAIGFVIIIYMSYLRDKRVEDSWAPTVCGSFTYSLSMGIKDYLQEKERQQGLWQCYCF